MPQKIPKVSKKYLLPLIILLVLVGTYFIYKQIIHVSPAAKYNEANERSIQLAEDGHYKKAAEALIDSYSAQSNADKKGIIANDIGMNYFYAKDYAKGREWLSKAENLFKKAGDEERAQSADQSSSAYSSLENIKPSKGSPKGDSGI